MGEHVFEVFPLEVFLDDGTQMRISTIPFLAQCVFEFFRKIRLIEKSCCAYQSIKGRRMIPANQ